MGDREQTLISGASRACAPRELLLIEHRVNTRERLARIPSDRGIEVDIREQGGELRLAHDPFEPGERLEDLLSAYRHALIVLNVKCDGLEERLLRLLERHRIGQYFFLDVAAPTLVRLARRGVRQIAVRFSEYEPIEAALAFADRVDWVWVDCFTRLPLDAEAYRRLRTVFKLCVVSPELQGHPRAMIRAFREQLQELPVDAVCTDYCEDWTA